MRKTIIPSSILALVGFAAVAQASEWSKASDHDATRVQREASDDSRGDRHDRTTRKEHSRDRNDGRHDESRAERSSLISSRLNPVKARSIGPSASGDLSLALMA